MTGSPLTIVKEEKQFDLEQVVEECRKQLQAQAKLGSKDERPGNAVRGKGRCCRCGEEGHMLRQCPTVQRSRAAQNETTRPKKSENQKVQGGARRRQRVPDGARGCQTVPDGARGCQMVPDGAKGCQMVPEGARGCQMGAKGCQMVPEGARGWPEGAR